MEDCGGGCTMLWRNGRRFREVLFRGRCMSVVNEHQAWKTRTKISSLVLADQREPGALKAVQSLWIA